MTVELSAWTYPWDAAALGPEAVVEEARRIGLDGLELSATYHAISAVSPRPGGRRLFYTGEGAVFFPARPERYGRIRPHLWPEDEVRGAWPRLVEGAGRAGLGVNAWVIVGFQPWLTRLHPELSRVLATGDPVPALVCPSSPDVQDYVVALCTDLADQFAPPLIHLEGLAHPRFDYGWVRPRMLAPVGGTARWLMAQCFCPSCTTLGTGAGIDVEALRSRVADRLARCLGAGQEETAPAHLLDQDPELRSLVALRHEAVVGLVETVAGEVRRASRTSRVGVWSPLDVEESEGVDLERVVDLVGSALVWSPARFPAEAVRARRLADGSGRSVALTHLQICGGPFPVGSAAFQAELDAARRVPVDRVALYNFGLVTEPDLARAAEAVRRTAAATEA